MIDFGCQLQSTPGFSMNNEIATRMQEVLSDMVAVQKSLVTDVIALRVLVLAIAMQPNIDRKKLGEDAMRMLESHVSKDSEGLDPARIDHARSLIADVLGQGADSTQT